MSRKLIIERLKAAHSVKTEVELMNELQNFGAVSDEAVTIADVADGDLVRAYNQFHTEAAA